MTRAVGRVIVRAAGEAGTAHRSAEHLDDLVLGVLSSAAPLSAYDISGAVACEGSSISTMQVYRVLKRLVARGLVLRIETLRAYARAPNEGCGFVVCRRCRAAKSVTLPNTATSVLRLCGMTGFSVATQVIEVSGLCGSCLENGESA